jgi:hypothetical protein
MNRVDVGPKGPAVTPLSSFAAREEECQNSDIFDYGLEAEHTVATERMAKEKNRMISDPAPERA